MSVKTKGNYQRISAKLSNSLTFGMFIKRSTRFGSAAPVDFLGDLCNCGLLAADILCAGCLAGLDGAPKTASIKLLSVQSSLKSKTRQLEQYLFVFAIM